MKTNVSGGFLPTWTHLSHLVHQMWPEAEEDARKCARKATHCLHEAQLCTNTVVAAAVAEVGNALCNSPDCLVPHHSRP